ncbi:protein DETOXIFICATION 43-like [Senna tora]|uniref:Protein DETOXIFICATION n=1 Tax=Senna tora TaxID=362788 RepID=A0A834X0R8_9FABA|nr:protein DETOXIFICATION 43-like [Senna tora]
MCLSGRRFLSLFSSQMQGAVELAAAGVSIALFNQASRITIFPLVSITTSFVAEEDTIKRVTCSTKIAEEEENLKNENEKKAKEASILSSLEPNNINNMLQDIEKDTNNTNTNKSSSYGGDDGSSNKKKSKGKNGRKRKQIASASTALLFGTILGLIQALTLIFAAKPLLGVMGVKPDSPMLIPAQKYLKLRSLGAPAVLLSLAMQGIFRGFKDTKTPLYVIVLGYAVNVALDPILIFYCKMGLKGAAIAHVFSQYLMALALFLILMRKVDLLPPSIKDLQIFRFLKNGGLLLVRVIAVTFCVTLAASLAARLGPVPMAAFQTCLQVWLTSSLLADGLAVAIQAILACSFAEKDYGKATAAATRVLQMSFVMGTGLSLLVGIGLYFGAGVFSKNVNVLHLIKIGIPLMVSIVSVGIEFLLYKAKGFIGIWIALSIYMGLRMLAGIWRMGTGTGPWHFLRNSLS